MCFKTLICFIVKLSCIIWTSSYHKEFVSFSIESTFYGIQVDSIQDSNFIIPLLNTCILKIFTFFQIRFITGQTELIILLL